MKIRTSPAGPEPSIRVWAGNEEVRISVIPGIEEHKNENRRRVVDLIVVCRAPEVPIIRQRKAPSRRPTFVVDLRNIIRSKSQNCKS